MVVEKAQATVTDPWPSTTSTCYLPFLKAGRPRSKCQQGRVLVRALPSWLSEGCFLAMSSHGFSSMCVGGEGEGKRERKNENEREKENK